MKTARLKNIVILILVLFNAFLLVLLFSQQVQQRNIRARSIEQLQQLFAASNLSIDDSVFTADDEVTAGSVSIDSAVQKAFASDLLGEVTESESSGISYYEGKNGIGQFRANGNVEVNLTDCPIESPLAFCDKLFKEYGYTILPANRTEAETVAKNGSGIIVGTRECEDGIIYNVSLSFTFSDKKLSCVSGTLLPPIELLGPYEGISATTALVDFLDYYNAGGLVCTAVTDLQCGYLLQGFVSAQLKLAPVWYIETDVSSYYVDCTTGEVSRA